MRGPRGSVGRCSLVRRVWFTCVLAAGALGGGTPAGCARGDDDPGEARDDCRRRDCGAVIGGADAFVDDDATGGAAGDGALVDATSDGVPARPDAPCAPPDGATCSTFPPCGCAEGRVCDFVGADGARACGSPGARTLHQRCSGAGSCAPGLSCVNAVCVPFCATSADCAGVPAATCRTAQVLDPVTKTPKPVPGYLVCLSQCDPVQPVTVCGAGTGCAFTTGTATACVASGVATTAGACALDPYACAPGFACVGARDCMRWCRVGFAGDCPSGKACGRLPSAPTLSGIELGVCGY